MPIAKTQGGLEISYRLAGRGERDLVFVHGWMTSGAVWDDLIDTFDGDTWRIIVPDLRGTGDSDSGDGAYALSNYVEDVRAVADAAGAEVFGLVGHSMGGQIAQLFAAIYPERVERLALLCPVPAAGVDMPDEARQLFINSGQDRERQAAILEMACLDLDERARARLLDVAGQISADCIRQSYAAWAGGGFSERLSDIEAITLVVGADDPFLPCDLLEAAVAEPIERAEFTQISGAGHYVQVERAEQTAALLDDFFTPR